jgi:integrase
VRLDRAIDRYIGELARRSCSPVTRNDYFRKLAPLCDLLPDADAGDVTEDDCRRYLDRWRDRSPGTIAHSVSVLNGFFGWLYETDQIPRNPMERIKRPRKPAPEDLDVVTMSEADVRRLFTGCETWHEILCLTTLAYLGPRRKAASNLRWRDVDLDRGTVRFREKGGKVVVKPIPDELAAIYRAAIAAGAVSPMADAYVIPMARGQRRKGERDDRVVWRTVKKVAERVGVRTTVHSIRAAFAVRFLETHTGDLEALQALMGHSRIETTQVYLRRLDRERAMERVRDLSWGAPFESLAVEAPTGFEPVYTALQAAA